LPDPDGVAHVPSPLKNVEEVGVPVIGFVASAVVLAINVPEVGPAIPPFNKDPVELPQVGKYPLVETPGPLTPPPLPPEDDSTPPERLSPDPRLITLATPADPDPA
jgi:hypothetical protein